MLAVSWYLQKKMPKPEQIGVSQGICARCQEVLDHYGIVGAPAGGQTTQNWVDPHRHANMDPPDNYPTNLPQKVTKGTEYPWKDMPSKAGPSSRPDVKGKVTNLPSKAGPSSRPDVKGKVTNLPSEDIPSDESSVEADNSADEDWKE
jgi:hypothetical protein